MAEFVFGSHAAKKTQYVLRRVEDALKDGKKVIIIVPEQQALAWDTLTAERLSPTDAFNVETVSFTRLADNVFRRFGGTAKKYITDSEKTLLMWNAVAACADRMEAFRALDREDRYAQMFLKTVNELKMYSVSPRDLVEAAEKISGGGTLPQRLRDLAEVYTVYDRMLHRSFCDPAEIPDALCDTLAENNYFSDCAVFIDSFFTLTPKEMKIVREILRLTDDVTVTFAVSKDERDGPDSEFVRDHIHRMAALCNKCAREIKTVEIPSEKPCEIDYLQKNLWDFSAAPFEGSTDKITVIKCADRYNEATLAAAQIKKLVAKGASYSQIAVVAADINALRGITDTELQRCSVPVYISGKTPLTTQPAFKLLRAALSVVGGGWKKESLCALLKTGLCGAGPDMCDAFEKYTDIWNINGKKMYVCDPWGMNPDGYTESVTSWGRELLSLANGAKELIVPPLEAFGEAFSGNVRDVCAAAYKLLCDFDVYTQLCNKTQLQRSAGETAAAQETAQVWSAICSLLDTVASVIPDACTDPFRFSSLLTKVASTCNIGTIPDGIDRVVLGSVTGMRLDGVRHLIVLGAVSGEFPKVPEKDRFFSDRDKLLLSEVGITLSPTTDKKLSEELFRFRYTVCSPEQTLTVLIPSGGECRPSVGASSVIRLFPENCALHYDFTSPEGVSAVEDFAGSGKSISDTPLCADRDSIDKSLAAEVFTNVLSMTQAKIEAFNDCPFKFYGQYVLHLKTGETARISANIVGNFVHAVLENFMREAAEENVFPVPDEVIVSRSQRLVNNYVAQVCPETVSSRRDWLFRRVHRSIKLYAKSLSEEFAQSRFKPYKFELPIGDEALPSKKIPLSNGAAMTLRGKIDRVDILRENSNVYLRVVDYKTGSKDFSKKRVTEGKDVQLLLYLFSLCNSPKECDFRKETAPCGEKILPAGALYFEAQPGKISSSSMVDAQKALSLAADGIERKGIVLGERGVVEAMDRDFSGRYAPATLDKDGEFTKKSSVETEEGFKEIEDAMEKSLSQIGDRILDGCAASVPEKDSDFGPCKYCGMKPFCRHSMGKGGKEDE